MRRLALQDGQNAQLARLLDAVAMQPPGVGSGRQTWPDYSSQAPPVHLPVEKDAVRLQVGILCVMAHDHTRPQNKAGVMFQRPNCSGEVQPLRLFVENVKCQIKTAYAA